MTTRIADLITNERWLNWFDIFATDNFGLLQSGVVTRDTEFDDMATSGGLLHSMPFYDDLPYDTGANAPNISSDDPAVTSTPGGITTGSDRARLHALNESWGNMSLNKIVNHQRDDPLDRIFRKIGGFWLRHMQQHLISSIAGVIADNVTNDSSDLFHDISGLVGAAAILDGASFVDAQQKLGDAKSKLKAFVCHSAVAAALAKNDLIDYIPDSKGTATIPTFQGKRVIEDDACPVNAGVYDSYLVAEGAFAWGEGVPEYPIEVERNPDAGNGEGQTVLYSRRQMIMHPRGFRWLDASVAAESPTLAELALGANWNRVFPQKYARFVGVRSKIA